MSFDSCLQCPGVSMDLKGGDIMRFNGGGGVSKLGKVPACRADVPVAFKRLVYRLAKSVG